MTFSLKIWTLVLALSRASKRIEEQLRHFSWILAFKNQTVEVPVRKSFPIVFCRDFHSKWRASRDRKWGKKTRVKNGEKSRFLSLRHQSPSRPPNHQATGTRRTTTHRGSTARRGQIRDLQPRGESISRHVPNLLTRFKGRYSGLQEALFQDGGIFCRPPLKQKRERDNFDFYIFSLPEIPFSSFLWSCSSY